MLLKYQSNPSFPERFPTIYAAVQKHYPGAMLQQLIPVTPGAHYTVGGIQTKVDGSTAHENVYAIGEAACTNFHGANRSKQLLARRTRNGRFSSR